MDAHGRELPARRRRVFLVPLMVSQRGFGTVYFSSRPSAHGHDQADCCYNYTAGVRRQGSQRSGRRPDAAALHSNMNGTTGDHQTQ